MTDMGIFRTTIAIQALAQREPPVSIADVIVDTGSEYTWIPRDILQAIGVVEKRRQRFQLADGSVIERAMGHAMIHAGGEEGPDFVVFGEPMDVPLLGAHTIEGLNLKLDLAGRQLVPGGPVLAVLAA